MPPFGAPKSIAMDEFQITRTPPESDDLAVEVRTGRSNCVKRYGPRQFVASWSSCPCAPTEPFGGFETPALLNKTSRRDSAALNFSAAGLMVDRSSSEIERNISSPGDVQGKALILDIADWAFDSERPARYTRPPAW